MATASATVADSSVGVFESWATLNGEPGYGGGLKYEWVSSKDVGIEVHAGCVIGTHGSISGTVSGNSISFMGSEGFSAYNRFTGTINGPTMSGTASSTILSITDGSWTAQRD